jgi:hypothetical protein
MAQPGARRVVLGRGLHCAGDARALQLPHPATGAPAAFLLAPDGQLLELNWHKSAYTSWFIGDTVVEGTRGRRGARRMSAVRSHVQRCARRRPVRGDAHRPALPAAAAAGAAPAKGARGARSRRRAAGAAGAAIDSGARLPANAPVRRRAQTATHEGRFCSVEHLLEDGACPALALLAPGAPAALPCVCAVSRAGGDDYYRLDDARALAWLAAKARALADALRAGTGGGAGAFAALGDAALNGYAVELLGEYVSRDWRTRLAAHLGCEASAPGPVVEGGGGGAPAGWEPHAGEANAAKKPKLSQAEKQSAARAVSLAAKNAKAATGTRSLASFFGGKSK